MFDVGLQECFFVLRLRKGDEKFELRHFFHLPTSDDWFQYHKKRRFMGLSKGKDTFEFANVMQEEDLAFWEKLVIRVEGYTSKKKDIMGLEDWKDKIPVQHKLEAVAGFIAFSKEEEPVSSLVSGESFDVDEEIATELRFVVPQNGLEHFLIFFFRQPETSDYVKFNRLTSRFQMVRTKQKNVQEMRRPTDIRPFVEMFDKLIVKVEGYGYEGKDLMEIDSWKDKIDALHKSDSVRELFTTPLLEEEEGNAPRD